jgi:hypothetical protein
VSNSNNLSKIAAAKLTPSKKTQLTNPPKNAIPQDTQSAVATLNGDLKRTPLSEITPTKQKTEPSKSNSELNHRTPQKTDSNTHATSSVTINRSNVANLIRQVANGNVEENDAKVNVPKVNNTQRDTREDTVGTRLRNFTPSSQKETNASASIGSAPKQPEIRVPAVDARPFYPSNQSFVQHPPNYTMLSDPPNGLYPTPNFGTTVVLTN